MQYKFVCREKVGHVLVSFESLIDRLQLSDMKLWIFRECDIHVDGGLEEKHWHFAKRSWEVGGLRIHATDLPAIFRTNFQLVDGFVDGYTDIEGKDWKITLDCFDASEWDITTDSADLADRMRASGFRQVDSF